MTDVEGVTVRHDLHPVAEAVQIGLTDESTSNRVFGVHGVLALPT